MLRQITGTVSAGSKAIEAVDDSAGADIFPACSMNPLAFRTQGSASQYPHEVLMSKTDTDSLNVWSRSEEPIGRLMSNFAHTPFVLDGVEFASVEGFWTWLLLDGALRRREKARQLWGVRAKWCAPKTKPAQIIYNGASILVESEAHLALMKLAIRAKLRQHPDIADSFVATRPRPIVHAIEGDGRRHERFCRILTELRGELA